MLAQQAPQVFLNKTNIIYNKGTSGLMIFDS